MQKRSPILLYNAQEFVSHHLRVLQNHDPFAMTRETWVQSLGVAEAWFERSFRAAQRAKSGASQLSHPMMTMDNMPHAGASQVHPHLHMIAGETPHSGCESCPRNIPDNSNKQNIRAVYCRLVIDK